MKTIFAMTLMLVGLNSYAALSGNDKGNGGDMCEARFYEIKNDITTWINANGANELSLPSTISLNDYKNKMLNELSNATVECLSEKLTIDGAEKTCINFVKNGSSRIQCNLERFMSIPTSEQYVLTHHEYAGLAGLETNKGVTSNYDISNQISGFLQTSIIKKLAIKKEFEDTQMVCGSELSQFSYQMRAGAFAFSLTSNNFWSSLKQFNQLTYTLKEKDLVSVRFNIGLNKCTWNFDEGRFTCKSNGTTITYTNSNGETKYVKTTDMQVSGGVVGIGPNSVQYITIDIKNSNNEVATQVISYPATNSSKVFMGWELCGRPVK